ncbi:MAG TPA: hypothetical protein VE127_04585 [Solirubrobacteraceae bacterium]|jgi:hypothetical protein|nr:hypothetical protein [Solirubrobacteraceae bacterium]
MSASVAERRWWLVLRLVAGSAVWSLGLVLVALLVPVDNGETLSARDGVTLTRETLIQSRGAGALALALAPLIACGLVAAAVLFRRRADARWAAPVAWTAVGGLAVVAVLGITSVGAFMLPVAVALAFGARLAPGWGDVRAHPA